jgi:Transcriptional regulators
MDSYEVRLNELFNNTFDNLNQIEEFTLRESKIQATISEVHFIEVVGKLEEGTISEIASELGITLASVTNAVNKLSRRGYMTKVKNPMDGRSVHVSLTKDGMRVFRLHKYFHRRMIATVTKDLTQHEKEVLLESVSKLNNFLKESAKPRTSGI